MSDIEHSYLDRLEKRLNDIEAALSRAQDKQPATPVSISPITVQDRLDRPGGRPGGNQNGPAREDDDASPASASLLYQGNGAMGEVDTAEDSIDGMGAIKFTDEEDWAYFGEKDQFASA